MSRKPLLAAVLISTAIGGGVAPNHVGVFSLAKAAPVEAAAPAPTVIVAKAIQRRAAEWDTYPARFAATDSVAISSRVSGHLTAIHFREGQIVKAGAPLFTIDQRPFEAALRLAKAAKLEAEARVGLARQQLARTDKLVARGHVSEAQGDTDRAEMQAAVASLSAAEAQVEEAELNLAYTVIRAPITGRIDETLIDLGGLVRGIATEATTLTTIVALDPIHVVFDIDQAAVLRYQRLAREGVRQTSRNAANPVHVALPGTSRFDIHGSVDFVGNQIDRATGTIRVRAVVPNPDLTLTPGMFASVQLLGRPDAETVLAPDEAVSVEQTNRVVQVVGANDRVETRVVETGPLIDGLRVIRRGLAPGERVIVEGQHRARAGDAVIASDRAGDERLAAAD
ncbi:MAG: efflux RND transporter periplasmic adaptor subunit [Pseudomonadota bacterium]